MRKLFTFFVAFLCSMGLSAQVFVTVGTGTTTNTTTGYPAPYGNYYWGARHQFIIPASEIVSAGGSSGNIMALGFDVAGVQGTPLSAFQVLIGTTTASSLSSWHTGTMTAVYSAASYTETAGWNMHTFASPYTWDGVSNLIVETCFNNPSWTNNASVYQTTTPYVSSMWYIGDNANVCTTPGTSSVSQRPNIRFSFAPSLALDAGISAINSPPAPNAMPGVHDVTATLNNYGTSTLTSATINWSVDNVLQTPHSWTGSLATGTSTSPITLGNYNFPLGPATIKVWSSAPNSGTDGFPGNDTTTITVNFTYDVIVGTGTASNYMYGPLYRSSTASSYDYSNYVYLYTAAELPTLPPGAIITEIAWEKANSETLTGNNFLEIKLENTNQTSVQLTSNYTAETTNSTVVFSDNNYSVPATVGWITHQMTAPFIYNGDNLKIAVGHIKNGTASGAINYNYTSAPGMAGGISFNTPTVSSTFSASYSNNRPNLKISYIVPTIADDAGVVSIDAPAFPSEPGNHDVKVTITTLGNDTLTSCSVNWSVNGVVQTPYFWTGNIPKFGREDSVTIGSFTFPQGVNEIVAWTSHPNNQTDSFPDNDTASVAFLFIAPLSGTYTIGGTAPDFPTFNDALTGLYAGGVAGPVTFNVAPGTYTEQLSFNGGIIGVSATNTILFQSATNDSTDVILEYAAVGAGDNWVVKLDGAQHTTFTGMTVRATGSTHGRVFEFMNDASYNSILNCVIQTDIASTSSFFAGIFSTSNTASNYVNFSNNHFIGGYYSIYWYATAATQKNHLVFENNILDEFHYYGAYVYRTDSAFVNNNILSNRTSSGLTYGIYNYYNEGYSEIIGNSVYLQGTSSQYGITSGYKLNTSSDSMIIANNLVHQNGATGTVYGIYLLSTNYVDVYHNTVLLEGGSATGGRALFQTTGGNINIKNNIFVNTGGGYAYYINTPAAISSSNFNNYYTTGNNLAYWTAARANLTALQTANSDDVNSASANPVFASPLTGNLTPLSVTIDNMGTPLGFTTDFYGNTRSTTTPDIGAIEFTGISSDLSLVGGYLTNGECLSANDSVYLQISNVIGSTVDFSTDPLTVIWSVSGPAVSIDTIVLNSGTLALGASLEFGGAGVDMSVPGDYFLSAWLSPSTANTFAGNDTLYNMYMHNIRVPFEVVPKTITVTSDTALVELSARSIFFPGGAFIITEMCHFKTATGSPTTGWPSYLLADDYIEITGVPNSDLGGYTLEQWSASAMNGTHTFPNGTLLSPNGTAVIAVGQLGSSTPSPANFYYHGNGTFTASYGSNQAAGRILKDGSGNIVDAVGYGNYTFPALANVPASEWSNPVTSHTGSSTSGFRLIGPDVNTGTNWVVSSATYPQDPNSVNSGVTVPTPTSLTGFTWSYNSVVTSTMPDTTVGPFTVNGIYEYIASYVTPCGTMTDTVRIHALVQPINAGNDTIICEGDSARIFIELDGPAPWTLVLNDGTANDTITNIITPIWEMYVSPLTTTTYEFVSYWDSLNAVTITNFPVVITVLPAPAVTYISPFTDFCEYDSVVVLTGGLPAGGTYTGIGVASGSFDPALAGPGSWVITYDNTLAAACPRMDSVVINVHPTPVASMPSHGTICSSVAPFALGGTPTGGTYTGPGITADIFDPATAGPGVHIITYEYTDVNTCTASVTDSIEVLPSPVVAITGAVDTMCFYHIVTLDAGAGHLSYLWSTGDVTQTIDVIGQIHGVGDHTFSVTVIGANGCDNTDAVTIHVEHCIGIDDIGNTIDMSIFPNPTNGHITLTIKGINQKVSIDILNVLGQSISSDVVEVKGLFSKEYDLSALPKGTYLMKVTTDNNVRTERIIVR